MKEIQLILWSYTSLIALLDMQIAIMQVIPKIENQP